MDAPVNMMSMVIHHVGSKGKHMKHTHFSYT